MIEFNDIHSRYKPWVDYLGLRLYTMDHREDILLLRWWLALNETGDIDNLVTPDSKRFAAFCRLFEAPTALAYTLSEEGDINRAIWFTPVDRTLESDAAYVGFWLDESVRGSKLSMQFSAIAHSIAFEVYRTVIALFWQPSLLDLYTKVGYNTVGCVPDIHGKEFCYIVHLSKDNFFKSELYQIFSRG